MKWRSKNQIIHSFYFLVIVLLVFVVGVGFLLRKKPTCFDSLLNQNEIATDCGGICEKVCPSEARNLEIKWTKLSKISQNQDGTKYSVSALVYNPNQKFYFNNANYQFTIKQSDGTIITRNGSYNIFPNSTNVIFEVVNSEQDLTEMTFSFDKNNEWKRILNYKAPIVTSSDISFDEKGSSPIVNLSINNEDIINYKKVLSTIIFYDKNGNVIDVSQTQTKDLLARTSRKIFFSFSPNQTSIANYFTYKVITYPVF